MVFEFKLGFVFVQGRSQLGVFGKGFQVDKICWEWLNFKGEGLQKFMFYEFIVGMFNVVGNVV